MRQRWRQLLDKIQLSMQGRYGRDRLSLHMVAAAVGLTILYMLLHSRVLYTLSLLLLAGAAVRMYSRNYAARRRELVAYERMIRRPSAVVKLLHLQWRERNINKLFLCRCGTIVRVPKGRGTLEVRCPKCGSIRVIRT